MEPHYIVDIFHFINISLWFFFFYKKEEEKIRIPLDGWTKGNLHIIIIGKFYFLSLKSYPLQRILKKKKKKKKKILQSLPLPYLSY